MSRNGLTQWGWREMEELLQCPVCLDIPSVGVVEQCIHGHHICASCRKNVETCPLCKCEFQGTRNFILEELLRHFDILKNTMLLNNIVIDGKPKKCKTKKHAEDPLMQLIKSQPKRTVSTPQCTKGTYPCRAPDCDVELPLARLLNHVRTKHLDMLTESEVDFTDMYSQTVEIPFKNKKPVNRTCSILFIRGIGLIYVNTEIMKSGQLIVYLQMASKFRKCQNFLASIELFSENSSHSYNIQFVSTRISFPTMLREYLCFTLNKNQLKRLCENRKFNLKLTCTRFDIHNVTLITRPNEDQIKVIAATRASLVSDQFDKRIVKKLDEQNNKKSEPKVVPSTSQDNEQTADIEQIVAKVLRSLNLQDARTGSISGTSSNNVEAASSTSNQCLTGRQNNKKKKNRR